MHSTWQRSYRKHRKTVKIHTKNPINSQTHFSFSREKHGHVPAPPCFTAALDSSRFVAGDLQLLKTIQNLLLLKLCFLIEHFRTSHMIFLFGNMTNCVVKTPMLIMKLLAPACIKELPTLDLWT